MALDKQVSTVELSHKLRAKKISIEDVFLIAQSQLRHHNQPNSPDICCNGNKRRWVFFDFKKDVPYEYKDLIFKLLKVTIDLLFLLRFLTENFSMILSCIFECVEFNRFYLISC